MRRFLPIILLAVVVSAVGLVHFSPWREQPVPLEGRLLKIHFLDVGQGDSILLQTPDGRNVLVDAGDETSGEYVTRYLARNGVHQIDLLVITHPHSDHIGGLPRVLEEFGVSRVLDTGYPHGSLTYRNVLSTIAARKIDYKVASELPKPEVSTSVSFRVLWPPADYSPGEEDLNDGSIVLRVKYGDVAVLLTGDIQEEAEGRLLASRQDLESTILKLAHHGSEYGTSNEFLQVVKPSFAVISVGADNPYGHPANVVLERLKATGAQVFRTDEQGTVVLATDGRNVQVRSER